MVGILSLEGILVAPTSGAPVAKSRMRGREGHLGGRLVAGCSCSVFNSCGSSSPQDGALFDECRFHGHAVVVPRRPRLRGHRHHETLAVGLFDFEDVAPAEILDRGDMADGSAVGRPAARKSVVWGKRVSGREEYG